MCKQKFPNWDFTCGPVVGSSPSNVRGVAGSIPGQGTGIPHASLPRDQCIKQKQCCSKFNKCFKNGPHQKNSLKNNSQTVWAMEPFLASDSISRDPAVPQDTVWETQGFKTIDFINWETWVQSIALSFGFLVYESKRAITMS